MNLIAGDIMSQPVIAVKSDTPIRNLMDLFEHQ